MQSSYYSSMAHDSPRLVECLQWCTKELTALVTNDNTDPTWQSKILQFLLLHSFFDVKKDHKAIAHVSSLL